MRQTIPAPRNVRETVLAFRLLDPAAGLPSLMGRLAYGGVSRRQVGFAVLDRAPKTVTQALDGPDFKPRGAMAALLNGPEFQTGLRELVLAAFPERRRLVFVHIAKCAGSDLQLAMQRAHPYLHHHMAIPAATPKPELFAALHRFAEALPLSDCVAVSGHVPLRWYTERALLRFEDEVFATVRHPRDIMYSFVSFLLGRIASDPHATRRDVRNWLGAVGRDGIPPDASPGFLAELGGQLLRAPSVTARNMICTNLGRGTATTALEAAVLTDIELTDTARYSAWRSKKFGFEPAERVNVSRPLFTPELASRADRAFIEGATGEDLAFYEKVQSKLAEAGGLSVQGRVFG